MHVFTPSLSGKGSLQKVEGELCRVLGVSFEVAFADSLFSTRIGQLGFSVIERRNKDPLSNLVDPRLGLPAEDDRCATCGGTNYEQCTGEVVDSGLV